jgi:hypothetical protein
MACTSFGQCRSRLSNTAATSGCAATNRTHAPTGGRQNHRRATTRQSAPPIRVLVVLFVDGSPDADPRRSTPQSPTLSGVDFFTGSHWNAVGRIGRGCRSSAAFPSLGRAADAQKRVPTTKCLHLRESPTPICVFVALFVDGRGHGKALPRGSAAALILRPSSFILRPYPNHWHN